MTQSIMFLSQIINTFSGLKEYLGNAYILFISLLIILILVLAINYIYRKNNYLNYLPGLLALVVGVFMLIFNIGNLLYVENLHKLETTIVLIVSGLCGIIFALLLSVIKKPKKKKKKVSKKKKKDNQNDLE